jgi:hypothetical protein
MSMAWSYFVPWSSLAGGFVAAMPVGMVLRHQLLVER